MKVSLEAFGGRLKGYYELPENWDGRDLWLLLDMDIPNAYQTTVTQLTPVIKSQSELITAVTNGKSHD